MMIARWTVEARFGRKQTVIDLMHRWWREIAPEIGWSSEQVRISSGALGAKEAAVEVEVSIADLVELNDAWSRLGGVDAQVDWARDLEPHIVSGSPRWVVHRVV